MRKLPDILSYILSKFTSKLIIKFIISIRMSSLGKIMMSSQNIEHTDGHTVVIISI